MPFMDYDDRYRDCVDCEGTIDREYDDYRTISSDCGCCDTFICYRCDRRRNERRQNGNLYSYSYKPSSFNPKGNYPTEVLMGVELEVGGDRYEITSRVAEVDTRESHLYCKQDCSIYGAEIVTHPMTLRWAKESNLFPELLGKLREDECFVDKQECGERGCGSTYDCNHSYGLHIHVSRNAFAQLRKRRNPEEGMSLVQRLSSRESETYEQGISREMKEIRRQQREQSAINHQMIWLMFIERNSDKLNGDMKLARRDSSQYGAFRKSDLTELRRKGADAPYYDESRYSAINCQNDKTYELRFFKSTLSDEEFFAAIEFADASVEFTRTLSANDVLRKSGLEWSKFVAWVGLQSADDGSAKYPNLMAQVQTLALV